MTDDNQERIRQYDDAQDDDQSTLPEHAMTERHDDTDDSTDTRIYDELDIDTSEFWTFDQIQDECHERAEEHNPNVTDEVAL